MASCPKCGRAKIRKRKDGRKKCRRCGFLPDRRIGWRWNGIPDVGGDIRAGATGGDADRQ